MHSVHSVDDINRGLCSTIYKIGVRRTLLTLGAHAPEGYGSCPVCVSVCLSVCLSVCPKP